MIFLRSGLRVPDVFGIGAAKSTLKLCDGPT
jgi:hypothetical protein